MIPERKDPYAALIEQFMQNTQGAARANEQRFMGQREERLIDEQRGFQVDQAAEQRRNQLTDAATALRLQRVDQMTQALGSMDPESEQFQQGLAFLEALRTDPGLTGQEALDYVVNGNLTLADNQAVNVNSMLPRYVNQARAYAESLEDLSTLRQNQINYMSNGLIPVEDRLSYYNNVVAPASGYSDEVKEAMLRSAGMVDQIAIDAALREGRLTEEQIRGAVSARKATDAQTRFTYLQLEDFQRVADISYETMVEQLEGLRQTRGINDRTAFMETGYVPEDAAAAQAMANSFGFRSVEDLRSSGRARYERIVRLESLDEKLAGLARQQAELNLTAGREQIDLMEAQRIAQEISNDREKMWGYIREKAQLGELAFAAARNGDTSTLRMLQGLAGTEEYGDALADVQFDALITMADEYAGEATDVLSHNREMRSLLLGEAYRTDEEGRRAFFQTAGSTFAREDFTPDADGRRPVDDQIDAFIDGMSAGAIRAGGGEEAVRAALLREAYRAKDNLQRTEAGAVLETLSEAVPSPTFDENGRATNNGAVSNWRTTFVDTAEQAGIDREVAEVIAAGLLDGSNAAYYKAMLDNEETRARTKLYLAQADELGVEEDTQALTEEQFTALDTSINSEIDSTQAMYNAGGCAVNPEGTSINTANIEVDCKALHDRIGVLQGQSSRLRSAFVSQEPFHLEQFYGTEIADDIGAQATIGDRAIAAFGDAVDLTGLEILREDARQNPSGQGASMYDVIRIAAANGEYRTVEEINAVIGEAMAVVAQRPAPITGRPLAETEIDTSSNEWREKSVDARVEELEGTTEWNALVRQVVEGEAELEESDLRAIAGQFGFIRPQNAFERGLHGIGLRDMSSFDIAGVQRALNMSASKVRRARLEGRPFIPGQAPGSGPMQGPSRTPPPIQAPTEEQTQALTANPGSTQAGEAARALGLVTTNNTAAQPVLSALITQESGGNHRKQDGSLTMSSAGALGITQVMPVTGWRPGHGVDPLFRLRPEDNARMQSLYDSYNTAVRDGNQEEASGFRRQMTELVLPYAEAVPESAFVEFGRNYLNAMLAKYGGDLPQALAAYNAGAGVVDRNVSAYGSDWLAHMPPETRTYVPNILSMAVRNLNTQAAAGTNVAPR